MAGNMDERVVSMEFDNKQFEKNVKTSMKTIDDLKESLDFEGVGESLDVVDKKFKLFGKHNKTFEDVDGTVTSLRKNLALLGEGGRSLLSQFAEVTKITALFEMAEQAVHRLQNAINQFTIAPIAAGFQKYGTKISSIKTIANATGMAAEQVDASLDRLNWFTDETSASFESMVQNIGKFTSVGKGLDESITAMQGIAAWGYHSGASVAEQTRAMYNLSQALGTGSVKLIDWKSIENAGMATKEFKEQAIAAAEAAGTLKRKGDKLFAGKEEVTVEKFNSTLAKGWFTSDVLMDTLKEYGTFADKVRKYQEEHPQYSLAADAMEAMDLERAENAAKQLGAFAGKTVDEVNGKLSELDGYDEINKYVESLKTNIFTEFGKKSKKSTAEIEKQIKAISTLTEKEEKLKQQITAIDNSENKDDKKQKKARADLVTKQKKALAEREKAIKSFAKEMDISAEEAVKLIDALGNSEESLGEKAFKSSQQAKTFEEALDATKDAVSTGWMKTFQYIFGGLDKSIELWSDVTEILWDLFAAGAEFRNNAFMHWAEEFNGWADLWNADESKGPLGALRNIMNTVIELKSVLSSSFKDVFFPELAKITGLINNSDEAQKASKLGLKTSDQIKQWREGNYMGYQLKQMTSGIREFTAKINEFFTNEKNIAKIRDIFTAIATTVKFAVSAVTGFFSAIGDFAKRSGIFQDILNVLSKISTKVTEVFNKLQASGFIQKAFGKITDTFVWFYNTIKGWIRQIKEFFDETGITKTIKDWFNGILEFFTGSEKDVDENGKRTESGFFRAFGWIENVKAWFDKINLKDILYDIKAVADNFGTIWNTFTQALGGTQVTKDQFKQGRVSDRLAGILEAVSNFGTKLSGIWGSVKGVFESVTGWLESSGILPTIRNVWDVIKTFFGNLGLVWEVFTTGKVGDPKALDEKQKGLVNGLLRFIKKLQGAWDKVKSWFTTAWAWIGEKWNLLVGWLESSGILPTIRNVWEKIKMFFGNIGSAWKALTDGFKYGANTKDQFKQGGMSDGLAGLLEWFSNLGASIRNIVNKISGAWDTAKNWLETSGILPTLRSWWASLTEWFEGVKKDLESNGVFKTVSDFFTNMWSWITGLFGGGEEEVITSTGRKLPKIDPSQLLASEGMSDVNYGKKKGGFFSGIIDTFRDTWTKDGKLDISQGFSKSIAGIFEWIGSIDWTGISTNIFGIMVDVVNGLNDALGKIRYQNIIRVIRDIVGIFSGLMWARTVGTIFSTIRSIVRKGNDKSLLEQFTELLSALGEALLQIGIAVALIAGSMWVISKIDPNRFDTAVNVMIGIGAFFLGFMVVAGILTAAISKEKNLAGTFSAIGGMFVQIGVAVALIVASIWGLTQMLGDKGEISDRMRNAMIIVGGIMLLMVGLIAAIGFLTRGVGTINVAIGIATFAGMAILIATITVCLMLLQGVDFDKSWKNALLLGGTLLAIALAMRIMNNVKIDGKTMGTMIVMAAILGVITAAFVLLKDTNPETIKMTALALGGVLLALAASMFIISKIPAAGVIKGAAGVAAALAILAVGIAAAAVILSIGAQSVLNNFVSVMSSMATASISAGLVDENKIRSVLGLLGEVAIALGRVGIVDSTKAIAVASAAWDVFNQLKLASVSASLVNEKHFYKIFGEDGNGGLLQIIQTGLNSVTDTGWKAASLGTHVEQLSESLKLVGQAGLMLNKDLEEYGNQTYTQGIQNVKDRLTDIQEIVQLATTMGSTGSGDDMKQIDLTKFSEGIANIGAALQLYNQALASFQNGGSNGADTIGKTDAAPLSTENISAALQSVMSALRGVTFDAGEVGAIESWAGLTQSGDGGTLFALGLTNIANAMGTFSTAAKDFDNDNVKNAVASLGTLADIQAKVTNPEQYKTTIDGITTWGDSGSPDHQGSFANAISSMGTAMAAFGQSVKDIPADSVTNATTALDTLATIYEKLKGKEDMVSSITETTKNWFGESTKTITYADQSSSTVFKDFSTGIGYLGDALAAFGAALSSEEYKYDENKVKTATSILESMVTMQKSLVEMKPGQGWFDIALFGENGFKKLGDNLSGLGSRLATFANELGGGGDADKAFDIDVNSDRWKNISGVLTYLVGLATELNNLSSYTEQLNEEGQVISSNMTSGFTLENLANGINKIRETMIKFNESMREWHTEGGGSSAQYQLGQWSSDNWNNIKAVLNDVKQLAIDMKSQNLSDADINLIGTFGEKIAHMFDKLNTGRSEVFGTADNVSQITEFVKKLSPEAGFDTSAFSLFITNLKGLAEAAGMLHGAEVNWDDIDNLAILAERIMSITTTGFDTEAFTTTGLSFATQFITGFINGLASGTVGEGEAAQSISGAIEAILDAASFFEKGKTAGAQYAAGFKEGTGDMSSFLSPVVSMDASGNTSTSGTPSLTTILTSMNYVTTDTISTSIANIEAIKNRLNETIRVDDGHEAVLSNINLKLGDLDTIKTDIGKLEGEINQLKVYISPDLLVGAIADKMDRALGNAARVSP